MPSLLTVLWTGRWKMLRLSFKVMKLETKTTRNQENVKKFSGYSSTQSNSQPNQQVLLHARYIFSYNENINIIITDVQGTFPFMAVELLINDEVEHSEKHDLESFFYVLLYICMMCEGPGNCGMMKSR